MTIGNLCLWRNVLWGLLRIFDSVLFALYEWFVYFGYRSLVSCLFVKIFPHSVGCLFVLLMVSFPVQCLLSLIKSHLFSFAFLSFALGDWFKKILLQFCLRVLWCPVLPLGGYTIWVCFVSAIYFCIRFYLISLYYM